ncbi:MAG: glycosyltransferase family 39 protein [Bacteroidetes bacterium]|nr:glycosyltransferase family 39 protein [Bacteroidota bacterium]
MRFSLQNKYLVPGIFLILLGVLLLYHLDDRVLWQDEAETANVAKTILNTYLPRGTDGLNNFSQHAGADIGPNDIWMMTPWVQFYITAMSFKLFGDSTLTARLPFAIIGLMTFLFTYYLSRKLWDGRTVGIYTVILLSTSVAFILMSRQARYYSPAMFLMVWYILGYWKLIENKRSGYWHMGIALLLLIHTHYVMPWAMVPPVLVHAYMFYRNRLTKVALTIMAVAVISVPFYIWFLSTPYVKEATSEINVVTIAYLTRDYFVNYFTVLFEWWLLLAFIILILVFRWKKLIDIAEITQDKALILLLLFVPSYLLLFSFTVDLYYLRYISPLIPVTVLIIARCLTVVQKIHRVVPIALVLLMIGLGYLPNYISGLSTRFKGPVKGIVAHLLHFGRPEEIVVITYGDQALKFYTKMRVIGALDGEVYREHMNADWIIIRHNSITMQENDMKVFISRHLSIRNYEIRSTTYSDLAFETREDPELHEYRVPKDGPKVTILKRIAP